MALYNGDKQIHELYNGDTYIEELYNGDTKIFDAGWDTTVTGNVPLSLPNARPKPTSWQINGKSQRSITIDGKEYIVPDGITLLEYASSAGSTAVDLGIVPVSTDDVSIKRRHKGTNTTTCSYFGCMPSSSSSVPRFSFGKYSTGCFAGFNYTYRIGGIGDTWHIDRIYYVNSNYYVQRDDREPESYIPISITECTLTAYLFARHGTSGVQIYDGEGTDISFVDWKDVNGNQKAYFIAAKNSSNVVGVYDFVSGSFIAPIIGTLTEGPALPSPTSPVDVKGVGNSGLPSGYKKLEYIESTGTQWIDTGENTSTDTELEGKITLSTLSNQMLWANNNTATNRISCYLSNTGACNFGDITSSNNNLLTYLSTTTPSIIKENSDGIFINGTKRANFGGGTISAGDTMYIFTAKNTGATGLNGKMYYCTIKKNNALVRNFIPAQRISDSVIGMYDLISDTFFTNAGTGSFIAGPEDTSCVVPILQANNCGMVDLGTLTWTYVSPTTSAPHGYFVCYSVPEKAKSSTNQYLEGYTYNTTGSVDKSVWGSGSYTLVCIADFRYTNATDFKSAMSGKYLYYQRTTDTSWNTPTITNITLPAPLQKVGTYTDSIESDGTLTSRVGVKVLDGTENFVDDGSTAYIVGAVASWGVNESNKELSISSHFIYASATSILGIRFDTDFNLNKFKTIDASITDSTTLKSWLAAQYAAGTPVIIYYPLATATETTVQVPTINTVKGTNYLDIQTEVEPSSVSITYRKRTSA